MQSGPAASISGSHGASSSTGTFGRGRDRRGRGRRGRVPVCLGRVSIHEATRLDAERAKEEEAQTAAAANLQLYRCWDQQHEGSASVKLDGSFIIAFMWQGQLRTTTRRRMDSEQVGSTLRSPYHQLVITDSCATGNVMPPAWLQACN